MRVWWRLGRLVAPVRILALYYRVADALLDAWWYGMPGGAEGVGAFRWYRRLDAVIERLWFDAMRMVAADEAPEHVAAET